MLSAPADPETMRAASIITLLATAIFVGSHLLGKHARSVRIVLAIVYGIAILSFGVYFLFNQ